MKKQVESRLGKLERQGSTDSEYKLIVCWCGPDDDCPHQEADLVVTWDDVEGGDDEKAG